MADPLLSVIILAGGRSERMGQDKAWLPLAGQPMVLRVARRLLPLAGEIIFCTRDTARFAALSSELPVPVAAVADLRPGAGPLAGLEAGLGAAAHDLALLVAVDMPFINLALLRHMIDLAAAQDVVVPVVHNPANGQTGQEPLHALYRPTCLPAIAAHLDLGHRRVVSFFSDVRTRELSPDEIAVYDPGFLSFFNINTPADWERARQYYEKPITGCG